MTMPVTASVRSAHRHVVRHLALDVAFVNETHAFDWQERLQDFMRGRGRDTINAVFDEFALADQVIALDQLDVDLGDLQEGDAFDVWQDRLDSRLRDALQHALARHHAHPARPAATVPRQQSDWQALIHYLSNGYLSWRTSNRGSNGAIADLITAAFKQGGAARLVAWLRAHAHPDRALRRLVPHLTDAQCSHLLAMLTPANAHDLDTAMQGSTKAGRAGPEQWLKLLAALLRCDPQADAMAQATTAIDALPVLAFAMAQHASSSSSSRSSFAQARLWAQTWRKLVDALQAEDGAALEAIWRDCLRLSNRRLRHAWLALGQHAEQRRRMARVFSQSMLLDLLALFAPGDVEFIAFLIQRAEAAVGVPSNPAEHADHLANSTGHNTRRTTALRLHLWEFTLTHLLADRGSVFNRRAYAAGLLQAAALSEGLDYLYLLQSMARVLRADAVATGLRRQLLQLLAGLIETARQDRAGINEQRAHDRDVAQSVKVRQSHCQRFAAALAAGDAYALHTMLLYGDAANVTSTTTDIQSLAGELRRLAQTPDWADSRRRLAATLSDYALDTIADALAPGEGSFVAVTINVIAPVAVEEGPAGLTLPQARYTLWEFTLTYLTADRGSRFNRHSYMRGVLHHMAEASGMHFLDFAEALRQSIARMPRLGQLQRQMAALIEELREDANLKPATTVANESRTERAWRARIANALQHSDEACWQRIWTEWAPRTPQVLREELRALAQQPQVLQRLVASLPARWRMALLQLLLPEQSDFVARVVACGEAAARAVRDDGVTAASVDGKKAHHALWEFSLLFVLGASGTPGSGFNRRAYAAFLLRKLAARDGVEYAALLLRITDLLHYLPSAKDAPDDLAQILLELGLSHALHASESVRHSQSTRQQGTQVAYPSDALSFDAMADAMADAMTDTKASKHHHIDDRPTYETLLQLLMSLLRAQHAIPDVAVAKTIVAWLDGDTSLLRAIDASAAMSHALALPSRHNGLPSDGKQPATPAIPSSPPTMAQAVRQEIDVWLRVPGRAASFATALSAGQRALLLQGMRSADYRAVIELVVRMAARC
ncbi:MAG: contractile injection system tape measure protein, partial [Burkholderiales bacterium]